MSEATENLSQEKLESLGSYAKRAREIELELSRIEEQVKGLAAEHKNIVEMKMPEILMEIGIEEFKLTTGEKLKLTTYYSASLSEENPNREVAFAWLRANGHDAIIKSNIKGGFGKGEEAKADELMKMLNEAAPGIFSKKVEVHPMTLKSFVKELCEAGTPPPAEEFRLFIGKKVTIK